MQFGGVIKRILDIIGSLILIIITSPLTILSALAVALESGWPVIYKNERVGEAGRKFFTLKFRSMRQKYCIGPQFDNQENAPAMEKGLI